MPYQVLARKWRPQTFADVVGQEHISRTLKNAILQNRIGHAYLFVGSRGIGKTTSARIFAKALNCSNNVDGEPCCQCQSCLEVANGSSLDVIEIDGASHNRVEHIRDIRDNVQYAPVHGKYKIYIIDEVHMLTTQAWNALLKTLEEPPPHVKFIFATTEPHKVLPTIVSRCQRFDLKRISVPLIVQRLRQIADGEKISVEDSALAAMARAADGGMRDAQSIFDQMIAFCGGLKADEMIREQDVIDVFGLASGVELRELAAALFTNDLNRGLRTLQELADNGRDLERLFADLIGYVRDIMVAALCSNPQELLELSESELADMCAIGKALDPHLVQRVLQGLVAQEWSFRAALNKRIYFEAVLARVMLDAHSVQIDDIMSQLNRISGALPPEQMPPPRPTVVIPPPNVTVTKVVRAESLAPAPAAASAPVADVKKNILTPPLASSAVPAVDASADVTEVLVAEYVPAVTPVPVLADVPAPPAEEVREGHFVSVVADDVAVDESRLALPSADDINAMLSQADGESLVGALGADSAYGDGDLVDDSVMDDEVSTPSPVVLSMNQDPSHLQQALADKMAELAPDSELMEIVSALTPVAVKGRTLMLAYDRRSMTQHHVRVLQEPSSLKKLNSAFQAVLSRGKLEITAHMPLAEEDSRSGLRRSTHEERDKLAQLPLIKQFNEIFDSQIIDARLRENP